MTWIAACRPSRAETVIAHSERILSATGAELAAVTLDADGVVVLQRESVPVRTHCQRGKPAWAVGAGDTYVTAFAIALAAGASAAQGAELAAAAASLVVDSPGTEACAATALLRRLDAQASRLTDESELRALVGRVRAAGGRVVFTNGVFDILHSGHIAYLSAARALGDLLVVGLNTDASVKRLKGPSRPVNHLEARAAVVDGLSAVDAVVAFSEATPERLIRSDQAGHLRERRGLHARIPAGGSRRGAVRRRGGDLPYADGYSTTSIIERATSAASLPRHSGVRGSERVSCDDRECWSLGRGEERTLCAPRRHGRRDHTSPALRAVRAGGLRRVTLLTLSGELRRRAGSRRSMTLSATTRRG